MCVFKREMVNIRLEFNSSLSIYVKNINGLIVDKFICDKIECPQNADSCVVSKRKDPKDPSVLVRSNICYSRTGEEVKKSVTTEAVNPNSQIKVLVEAYRNGGINSINTINTEEFDEEAFATQQAEFNENMENLHRGLAEMRYRLEHMFD